jgi:hypothetical protein
MGLSITLYRINSDDFTLLTQDPQSFSPQNRNIGSASFEKTFEGLCFVLSKGRSENEVRLLHQIFYPVTYVGDQFDASTLDLSNFPDNTDLPFTVSYTAPELVNEIANLLGLITTEEFQVKFDHNELNAMGIYPAGVWNTHTDPNYAFNVSDLTKELHRLKLLFKSASEEGDYILVYHG